MGALDRTFATLRFFGEELDPDEITEKLGTQSTAAERKGDARGVASGGQPVIAPWRLGEAAREPGELDAQIAELLACVTSDLAVGESLPTGFVQTYFADCSCPRPTMGTSKADTLAAIGDRGLTLNLDIYGLMRG